MSQVNVISAAEYKKTFVKSPGAKKKKDEEKVQLAVCNYLRTAYPDVIWFCDLASGLKLPIWIAALHKKMRSSRGLPDLFIAKEVWGEGPFKVHFNGLFIELKKKEVRLKSGGLAQSDHLREQCKIIEKLQMNGFRAEICCGFDEAKAVIDEYLRAK